VSAGPTAEELAARWDRGLASYANLFGIEPSEVFETLTRRSGERLATEAVLAAGSGVWDDDALSLRERRIIVISALVTQGAVERIGNHLERAFDEGMTLAELDAMMHLLALYAGFPRATIAMNVARRKLVELGRLSESQKPDAP
jgi:alkylhydroperoxidase/carboxymuconolactone decarboxylase family protein YurZ